MKRTFITFGGKTMTLSDWARSLGINQQALSYRLNAGWPLSRALTEGPLPANQHWHFSMQRLTWNGRTLSIKEWAAETGISEVTIRRRLKAGASVADALSSPPRSRGRGRGSNFAPSIGTGGGSTAQETAQIDFPSEAP